MIWLRRGYILFVTFYLLACQPVQDIEKKIVFERETLINLMVNKENHLNKGVLVTGIYKNGAIYFSSEHASYNDLSYAIALINDVTEQKKISGCNGHWVSVQGFFQPYFNKAKNITEGKLQVVRMSTAEHLDCFNVK